MKRSSKVAFPAQAMQRKWLQGVVFVDSKDRPEMNVKELLREIKRDH